MDKEKAKEVTFSWTDAEIELLLEAVKVFAATCLFEGKDWEGVKAKYDKTRNTCTQQTLRPFVEFI